ncbi:MAG: outer membrane lipoprotein chaperone LolA, partial [Pseudomonadales bacterium]|nr:outer membrane lipoprotein chaperone LolA [Pseudomonadales bacterium]
MKNSVFLKGLLKSILIVSLVFSLPIQAANDASERLTNLLMAMQSFQANFKQITLDGRGDTLQEMVGELAVQRPGLVYWKTNPPLEQLVVSDGDRLWL